MKSIFEMAKSQNLDIKLRSENFALWHEILLKCDYIPVSYSNASIDFQLAYQRGHGGVWEDISMIIYWDNRPVSLWPISISKRDDISQISSHGQLLLPPIFLPGCAESSIKKIIKHCLKLVNDLAVEIDVYKWQSSEIYFGVNGLSEWHLESVLSGANCSVYHDLYLNLKPDMVAIKSGFRKSYKSLITAGMRLWSVNVLTTPDREIWAEFKNLHFKVSGRVTRSDETWVIHLDEIRNQTAFLIYLRDEKQEMIGAGFFTFTRDEAVYAVAAYDRSLFDKPIGHVVQYTAIQEFKNRLITWYKIGYRPFKNDLPEPTTKEISIAEFKQGFSSHVFPRFVNEHSKSELEI